MALAEVIRFGIFYDMIYDFANPSSRELSMSVGMAWNNENLFLGFVYK